MILPVRFLTCNIFISLLLGFLLLFKRGFKKHITLKVQYSLWYVFVFSLFLPFVPLKFFSSAKLFLRIQQLLSQRSDVSSLIQGEKPAVSPVFSKFELTDSSQAFASADSELNNLLWIIWITGMILAASYFIYGMAKIYFLRKNASVITSKSEPDLYAQYLECLDKLHIRRKIALYASCRLKSPVSYGFLRPRIIIPQDMDILLSENELRFILLHELQHYKRRDSILNYLACLLQILYWFNPFLWYGFRQMQKDREIACDHSVIDLIGKEQCINYGYTLLRYAKQMRHGMFLSPVSTMGGNKSTIRQRIIEIADYKKDTRAKKVKSIVLLLIILLPVYCFSPFFTAYASSNSYVQMKDENWKAVDVSPYFHGTEGSFVFYDMADDQYQIYNSELSTKRISPDSTFKIYSGLFALEEHIITPENSRQEWDETRQPFDTWEQDQTLNTAMKHSVNWYFQNLDRQLGLPALYSYYSRISYGNCDLTGGTDRYWAESSLKISPLEQVTLLSDLLQNKWGFEEQNIEAVKDSLYLSDLPIGKLYGKTGTGLVNGHNANGWFVGFLETKDKIYCFASNLQNSEISDGSNATEITVAILNYLL